LYIARYRPTQSDATVCGPTNQTKNQPTNRCVCE